MKKFHIWDMAVFLNLFLIWSTLLWLELFGGTPSSNLLENRYQVQKLATIDGT